MRWQRLVPRPRPETVGLVLSGGGSRSSFQIGALTYLYDRAGITPQVITGTSAGAILGSVLAQSADHAGQRLRLRQLEQLWREMQDDSDMFTELEWYARLRRRGPEWVQAFTTRRERRQGPLGRSFTRVATLARTRADDESPPDDDAVSVAEVADEENVAPAPTRPGRSTRAGRVISAARERTAVRTQAPTAGSTWNPVSVVDLFSVLREVGRARPDLEIIVRGAERERSMYRPGPIVDRLLEDVFDPARVAGSGVVLRVAVVGLESGELRYVTETGRIVDRENRPVPDEDVADLVEAIRASCAIPAVFAPVRLGEEHYVDGGVRETLPTEVAVEHLGATKVYAVVASPPGVPRHESYAEKDMFSIVLRSTAGIMSDESLHDEVAWARAAGAVVIIPELDVHDALTIDPGLTAIAMDYGYLRAAEVVAGATEHQRQLVRELVTVRREAWSLETDLFGPDDARPTDVDEGPDGERGTAVGGATEGEEARPEPDAGASDRESLAALKRRLRAVVAQLPADLLPPLAEDWWREFERHPFEITESPWWTHET